MKAPVLWWTCTICGISMDDSSRRSHLAGKPHSMKAAQKKGAEMKASGEMDEEARKLRAAERARKKAEKAKRTCR